jgi:ribosomal protein S18 acetylase RimI-like enzyme
VVSDGSVAIVRGGPERIVDLEQLYAALYEQQCAVTPVLAGMDSRSFNEAWALRRASYQTWLGSPGSFVLIAERAGRPVGFAVVTPGDGYHGWNSGRQVADLYDLVVLPAERNRGIGSDLMDAVERVLAEEDVAEYRLRVLVANSDAIRFYERRGMAPAFSVLIGRVQRH